MKMPKNGMNVFSRTIKTSSASPARGVRSFHPVKKNVHSPLGSGNASLVMALGISGFKIFFSPFASRIVLDLGALNSSAHCECCI